ncbi:putative Dol-P-Glc:Glc(2)Man(9)GlcNAc(2)-PP-Dol alpha-1,2-glucosyltransferase [Trichoplusia ni]|uniref:Dol-P-Glc:Glc(2)Man(9)GlcNAc(2)-PP-Dol alpha-1,2-glucosyltransferase n=1 Tax=Trichoplusia ni TaxID=7111 RepID=A0A7E5WTL7_TRINI|nr:putative Dol-P-Glc:Glc(2)Man(9)GlcNAc(2)-PP-Dol alpha-1,2-glucosyltransferase [Trichoplusia ni]
MSPVKAYSTARFYTLTALILVPYFVISKLIFDRVHDTSQVVIDEYFHVPQGLAYCNGNFSEWNPKITTLPGLYLVTAFVGQIDCDTYNLRFINLLGSCINLIAFASILKYIYFSEKSQMKIILQAVSLTILPPLYFFSHVYYTETLSVMFLLIFTRISLSNRYLFQLFIIGNYAVLMRQTNIIWVALVLLHKLMDVFIKSSRVFGNPYINDVKLSIRTLIARDIDRSKLKRYYGMWDVYCATKYHLSTMFGTFFRFLTKQDLSQICVHLMILLTFAVFIHYNGGIVVGDKQAHEVTLHLPQLLYFLLFYGVFGLPYVLLKLFSTIKLMFKEKILVLLCGIVFILVVHHNTMVHPYMLADNRHYTFYIWNRWFGKYDFAVYATIPVYIFLLFSLYDNLKDHNCITFLLPYTLCLIPVLTFQKLIEIRYFLCPYIVIRLRFTKPPYAVVIAEFLWYIAINIATFYVFFTKEVYWKDFDYAQRIIW